MSDAAATLLAMKGTQRVVPARKTDAGPCSGSLAASYAMKPAQNVPRNVPDVDLALMRPS